MKIYPAIDLREGATVQLVGGDPSHEAVHDPDPVRVAHKWMDQGASALHMVDLDAAMGLGMNLHVVKRILDTTPLPVQLGGGIRHLVDIQARLDMGVGRVIVGTQGIKEPEWFETATELYPGKIVLAVDARGDEVAISGWKEGSGLSLKTVLDRVMDLPLAGILYTNVDIEGSLSGIDRAAVERVVTATQHDVIASGGIATMDDLDVLKDVGALGAVLGMSIYTGRIDLKAAIERLEERTVETGRHVMIPKPAVQWGFVPEDTPEERVVKAPGHNGMGDHTDDTERTGPSSGATPPRTAWGKRRRSDDDHETEPEEGDT